jgi:hypothetical protein
MLQPREIDLVRATVPDRDRLAVQVGGVVARRVESAAEKYMQVAAGPPVAQQQPGHGRNGDHGGDDGSEGDADAATARPARLMTDVLPV